jgi:hypothetical protein
VIRSGGGVPFRFEKTQCLSRAVLEESGRLTDAGPQPIWIALDGTKDVEGTVVFSLLFYGFVWRVFAALPNSAKSDIRVLVFVSGGPKTISKRANVTT